ncbi:MAG TPA: helix-turn-helix transcriptional regulator [Candidatus Polarisedimenticolaceae bacterium]|nr:helix-turn-helix transcriptional regulator [Candidatus Polarisedimenticolaceae bacterium]
MTPPELERAVMSNIASVLKQEITRLSRKATKSETAVLRRATAQYRRDIAELKRQVAGLSKQVAYLERQERKRATSPAPAAVVEGKRFSRRGLETHRKKLDLSAADYARLVGVTGQTVYNWEQGKSRPRDEQLAALVEIRGLGKREAQKRLELLEG